MTTKRQPHQLHRKLAIIIMDKIKEIANLKGNPHHLRITSKQRPHQFHGKFSQADNMARVYFRGPERAHLKNPHHLRMTCKDQSHQFHGKLTQADIMVKK